jgi:lipid-A-disaccharide synthase
MFVAGENSGDLHAARLIAQLRTLSPGTECFGYGGVRMEAAGMRLTENLAQKLPIIGFTQAMRSYGQLKALFARAVAMLEKERPDALVLVDYPGFNLRLAREAHRLQIPVIYFIAPQIWAWHHSRLEIIKRAVSRVLVIFAFEKTIYEQAGVPVDWVGHPLLDDEETVAPRAATLERLGISPAARVLGLIPGSRDGEVVRHLPALLGAARLLRRRFPDLELVVPRASTIDPALVRKYLDREPDLDVRVAEQDLASVRAAMDFAICKSGTSTLELALHDVPMVIVYKVSPVTAAIARMLVRIPWIGLVNIVANEEVAPELIQSDATPDRIATVAGDILASPEKLARMRAGLEKVRAQLGSPGASRRAAKAILNNLGHGQGG